MHTSDNPASGCLGLLGQVLGLAGQLILFLFCLTIALVHFAMGLALFALAVLLIPLDLFTVVASVFSKGPPPPSACGGMFKSAIAILAEAPAAFEKCQGIGR